MHRSALNSDANLFISLGESSGSSFEALHQDGISRLASIRLSSLATIHSSKFVRLVNESVHPEANKTRDNPRRRGLWRNEPDSDQIFASSSSFTTTTKNSKDQDGKRRTSNVNLNVEELLPEWYSVHNPRCQTCHNPIVRGLTTQRNSNGRLCSNCRSDIPTPRPNKEIKKSYPSVRKRKRLETKGQNGLQPQKGALEKGQRKRQRSQEIVEAQPGKKIAVKDNQIKGTEKTKEDATPSEKVTDEQKVKEQKEQDPSSSTAPSRPMTLEDRAAELKRSKAKNRARELGAERGKEPRIENRNGLSSPASSKIEAQRQQSDPTPSSESTSQPEKSNQTSIQDTAQTSTTQATTGSSATSAPSKASTSRTDPDPSSSSRRRSTKQNPKSDLKALLAREKSRKEAQEREREAQKNLGASGLRGFLDSL